MMATSPSSPRARAEPANASRCCVHLEDQSRGRGACPNRTSGRCDDLRRAQSPPRWGSFLIAAAGAGQSEVVDSCAVGADGLVVVVGEVRGAADPVTGSGDTSRAGGGQLIATAADEALGARTGSTDARRRTVCGRTSMCQPCVLPARARLRRWVTRAAAPIRHLLTHRPRGRGVGHYGRGAVRFGEGPSSRNLQLGIVYLS